MSEEKKFCGSAKIIKTQYGELTKVSFREEDLDLMKENLSNGWINLVIKEKREKIEGKPTHYLQIDDWKPNNSPPASSPSTQTNYPPKQQGAPFDEPIPDYKQPVDDQDSGDLPF